MNKKFVPYVIGVPNMGVGLLWAMNMVLIPMLAGTIAKNNSQLAILVSMGAFTGIFVQYLAGIISDRSNFKMGRRKPFIIIGAVVSAFFMCLMPFTKSYLLLFITAFLFYFSLNFYQGPYYSLIPEVVEDSKLGLANGFSKVVSVIGSGIIFIVGPSLWDKNKSLPFFIAAALGLVTVLGAILFIKEDNSKIIETKKIKIDFYKYPAVFKLFMAVFFIYLSYGCITPFFVKYCVKVLSISEGAASTGLLLITVAGAVFAYPIGILSDKIERRKVLMLGAVVFTIALVCAIFIRSTGALYIMLSFIGIGFIAIQVTVYSILAEIVPPERLGEFMGIINLFISLGQFITNNIMGIILDKIGFSYYFPVSAALMFVAVLIIGFSKYEKYNVKIEENITGQINF